jgi:hypothetical protein
MSIKYGKFELVEETINNILNTNALLIILNKKGIISADEFMKAKEEALREFKQEFPELFQKD